jgi:leucyl aminopeptidase
MKAEILKISSISPDQSVVCIMGSDQIPVSLALSNSEKEFVRKRMLAGEESVLINSYNRWLYLVKLKADIGQHKVREELRKAAYNLRKQIKANNHSELVITDNKAYAGAIEDFTEGLVLSMYAFDKYKTIKEEGAEGKYPDRLLLCGNIDIEDLRWLVDTTDAVYFTRDLTNEPVNHLNAAGLAAQIRKIGDSAGFSVEILTKGKIEALKMGGLLAVNKGSVDPPVFSILEWHPSNCVNEKPIVLVGKGIVYDTGGLNIKTGEFMAGMNGDMAGAAIVTGVLHCISRAKIPLYVVGLIPSTDNRPGGNAYTQGDIIRMYNKMTV